MAACGGDSLPSHEAPEEDDEDEYEDQGSGSRLLGFMFGNVNHYGDLDADYLDEDAKEHLSALADKLGPSLTVIDGTKSPPAGETAEQDYDEKAEDAVDYQDIDEQYEGPEVQSIPEESSLLQEAYLSRNFSESSVAHIVPLYDEENYDEEEGDEGEVETVEVKSEAERSLPAEIEQPFDSTSAVRSPEDGQTVFDAEEFEEDATALELLNDSSGASLPILCIDDGTVILRFSEIFGIHEPLKRVKKKDKSRVRNADLVSNVEEDEVSFLRASFDNRFSGKISRAMHDAYGQGKEDNDGLMVTDLKRHTCLPSQPMKEDDQRHESVEWKSEITHDLYPLHQLQWEDEIFWGNSPPPSQRSTCSSEISECDSEMCTSIEERQEGFDFTKNGLPIVPESHFYLSDGGSAKGRCPGELSDKKQVQPVCRNFNPQAPSLRTLFEYDETSIAKNPDGHDGIDFNETPRSFRRLTQQNKELSEGNWLDQIIWDSKDQVPKPKLIFDLRDEQMLFEILDPKEVGHLHSYAGAMIMNRLSKATGGQVSDHSGQTGISIGKFNISNDRYYSSRKIGQQSKNHTKKRAIHGLKVLHSVPALKLQTVKPKLSNKDMANFHRPRALWFPHVNEFITKIEGVPSSQGSFNIIVKSLGGKGTKFRVSPDEMLLSLKLKFGKKLDFKEPEAMKVFYMGRELEDDKSLYSQNVRPNSLLHLIRTKIYVLPRAQKLPGENKPLRPPGAFKKKSDLSVKDGHVFLMEYCEERPLLLGNVGMGARLCTYYQKSAPGDQTATTLRNSNNDLGNILSLEPADRSPYLGDIKPGCYQSSLETNMYRAPLFPHKLPTTDYLLVRSAKGMLSLRRIDKLFAAGQQEPHMEAMAPGTKNVQNYIWNRLLVHVYREFRIKEKPGFQPCIRADDLCALFPSLTEAVIRKRLKHCADLKRGRRGVLLWEMKSDFHIPSEEELRRMVTPENVCCYESMQAGLYRLKQLGIGRLTHPVGLSSAMNQLPDEAIALAAASHIERELLITSWNLSTNFVACTSQDRENIERLEITGVGDPSGRGLGFSYVRVTPKAPVTSTIVKKKAPAGRGGSTVTGTDADLRRLSMDAAREVLLKFNVPDEQIEKLTRWHRIALVRRLSSEQAASGVTVDAAALCKFARGQRMSFLQLQQQTREKCQEIWDRQGQSLTAAVGDGNESDSGVNSDLDSFAGDLENLLDAEEFEEGEDGYFDSKLDKADVVKGLKMRRGPSQSHTKEEIEDDEAEAVEILRLLEDDELGQRKKTVRPAATRFIPQIDSEADDISKKNTFVKRVITALPQPSLFASKDISMREPKEVIKEKRTTEKPVREGFVCGACGQAGHMRTNKNCPKYGEELDLTEVDAITPKSQSTEVSAQLPPKTPGKKPQKLEASVTVEKLESKIPVKLLPLKFKCSSLDLQQEKISPGPQSLDKEPSLSIGTEDSQIKKIKKIIISKKPKPPDQQQEARRASVVIKIPAEADRDQPPPKKIIFKQTKSFNSLESVGRASDVGVDDGFRKIKKITELAGFDTRRTQPSQWVGDDERKGKSAVGNKSWEEEGSQRRRKERITEEWEIQEEQRVVELNRFEDPEWVVNPRDIRRDGKKKKKKKSEIKELYPDEFRAGQSERRKSERDRAGKRRSVVDLGIDSAEYALPIKRRRGGEVLLCNILENVVDMLRNQSEISYLFLKPVSRKEAPDYLDIIKRPMDLATIKEKVRKMEYKGREDFRHDVWQITFNAHRYNDGRNPGIPPLSDQLLELCDYLLEQNDQALTEAEAGIEI
ncbi:HAC13 protein (HAC13) isoform X2 [Wolffia australiana]